MKKFQRTDGDEGYRYPSSVRVTVQGNDLQKGGLTLVPSQYSPRQYWHEKCVTIDQRRSARQSRELIRVRLMADMARQIACNGTGKVQHGNHRCRKPDWGIQIRLSIYNLEEALHRKHLSLSESGRSVSPTTRLTALSRRSETVSELTLKNWE